MQRWQLNAWWITVQIGATALVLLFIGPFASRADLVRLAQDTASSPWQQLHAGTEAGRIAVVLVDDADVTALDGSWPLSYGTWALLLKRLGCAGAQAVFFDVLFGRELEFSRVGEHGGASFAQVDARLRQGTLGERDCPGAQQMPAVVPVFYAYAERPQLWLSGVIDDDRKLPIQWSGVAGDYPLQIQDGARTLRDSVGLHLYRLVCADRSTLVPPGCATPPDDRDLVQRLVPRWPMRDPQGQDDTADPRCANAVPVGVVDAARQWLRAFPGSPDATPCLPFLTLSARDLLQGFDAETAAALRGRVVLVGASITGTRDLILTTTHGQLPAVFLHATALENLLAGGGRFDRVDAPAVLQSAWALIVAMALAHRASLWWSARRGRGRRQPLTVEFVLLPVLWCGVAAWMRWGLLLPPGMVSQAALTMSLGLLLGELSQEGRWYGRLKQLQPELSLLR